MLKTGVVILSVWSSLNLLPSIYVIIGVLFLGHHPPGLYAILTEDAVNALSPEVLATVDSIGLFANLSVAAFNVVALVAIWKGLNQRVRWVFWALVPSFSLALLAGVAADYAVGFTFPEVNLISALILAVGLGFSGIGLFSGSPDNTP